MSVNKIILLGRLGKDPEVRQTDGGKVVANFSLATTEKYTNQKGEKVENTEWHNIVLWGKTAEIAQKYLHKGDQVYIEGKIRTRKYDKGGETRYITEVVGDNLTMLGGKKEGVQSSAVPQNGLDDMPF